MYIEADDIFKATNGGLDIIIFLYPDASESVHRKNRKFKIREEKTASCSLKQLKDGNWLVTDFGSDSKPRNGVLCYMHEKNLDYGSALKELALMYNVVPAEKAKELIKAEYADRPATAEDEEGSWSFDIRDSFNDNEIETLLSKNTLKYLNWKSEDPRKKAEAKAAYSKISAAFKEYRFHPLISYSIVKNRKVMTFSATEHYPMFLIDEGSHKKIYQPRHPDKSRRFMYHGEKPKDFIHGLDQIKKAFAARKKKIDSEKEEVKENNDRIDVDFNDSSEKKNTDPRLGGIFLVSGGSDAINLALLDIRVDKLETAMIWLNSETAELSKFQHDEIMIYTKKFYQLQDIDLTGKSSAHDLGMKFLDIYTIELPEDLKKYNDNRGNPCKDLRDYLNHYKRYDLNLLIENALPYRFWEKKPRYEGRGENRIFVGYDYEFDPVQCYNFLQKNGFYRLPVGDKDSDWEYIQIDGNTIRKTDPVKIKAFIKNFLRERMLDKDLRNKMLITPHLGDSSLSNLDEIFIDFVDYNKTTQFLFFKTKTLKITASEITEFKPGKVNSYIWEQELLDHPFELIKEEPFTITKDELGAYDIKINSYDCCFLKYLIQTSRVHWRAELEGERIEKLNPEDRDKYIIDNQFNIAGPNLTPEEIGEQKQHLINKLFTIGYLMHRYKDRSRPWFVYAMDNRVSDDGRSHGGSGKSILFDVCMRHVMKKNFYINGRLPKVMEDTHKYDGLTEHDRYVLIEDANEYFRLDILFNDVTGDVKVNPKGKKPFTITFDKAPKFAVTTNYTARNLDSSTMRRMLYYVCSDYYHTAGETNDYKETRDPKSEFGFNMITDYSKEQFNYFYNTLAYALKFYLGCTEKIGPAMNNVTKRQLKATMGEGFEDWATAYFDEEGDKLNAFLVRSEVYKDCTDTIGKITPQSFMDRLRAFCRLNEYSLNPRKYQSKAGNIIRKHDIKEYDPNTQEWKITGLGKKTMEMLFIETIADIPEEVQSDFKSETNLETKIDSDTELNDFFSNDPGF